MNAWQQVRIVDVDRYASLGNQVAQLAPLAFYPADERETLVRMPCTLLAHVPPALTLQQAAAFLAGEP